MKHMKKFFAILMAAVFCLSLAACGSSDSEEPMGDSWRNSGILIAEGTIIRDGESTFVLVSVNETDASFYYDSDEPELFDSVDYPITFTGSPREAFQSIDFTDLNGDGNSDVTMKFNENGNEITIVWYWDWESGHYMFQPDQSQLGGYDDGRGDVIPEEEAADNTDKEAWSDPGDGGIGYDEDEGRGDYIEDDGYGDYIVDDGSGDYFEDEGQGDYFE